MDQVKQEPLYLFSPRNQIRVTICLLAQKKLPVELADVFGSVTSRKSEGKSPVTSRRSHSSVEAWFSCFDPSAMVSDESLLTQKRPTFKSLGGCCCYLISCAVSRVYANSRGFFLTQVSCVVNATELKMCVLVCRLKSVNAAAASCQNNMSHGV